MTKITTDPQRREVAITRLRIALKWGRKIPSFLDGASYNQNCWSNTKLFAEIPPTTVEEASACGFEGCFGGWLQFCTEFAADTPHSFPVCHNDMTFATIANFFYVDYGVIAHIFRRAIGSTVKQYDEDPHDPTIAVDRLESFMRDEGVL